MGGFFFWLWLWLCRLCRLWGAGEGGREEGMKGREGEDEGAQFLLFWLIS